MASRRSLGTLQYGSARYELDDDTLRHFAAVATSKLRRNEPFLVLVRADDTGLERIWLHAAATLRIETQSSQQPLDRGRLEHMVRDASRPSGLDLCTPWHAPTAAARA